MSRISLIRCLFPAFAILALAISASAQTDSDEILLGLQTPQYRLGKDSRGFDIIKIEGFSRGGIPGNPELPVRAYDVALPPDVNGADVQVEVVSRETAAVPGTFEIPPASPPVTFVNGVQAADWGLNKSTIVDGRNILVYAVDSLFPAENVARLRLSKMRRWNFARLMFSPVQYNPVTGQVVITTAIQLRITFSRKIMSLGEKAASLDIIGDADAAKAFVNYASAKGWYQKLSAMTDAPATTPEYVIITTGTIVNASSKLAEFAAHKRSKGFNVEVITEADWGGLTGQAPNGNAEKIRKWLQDNYVARGIQYVLLIGNPDPASGDVPMKWMWPRYFSTEWTDFTDAPSDYFYADLTGNWDLNGDTVFGDWAYDWGTGGVDFTPEVFVGRIPVYQTSWEWQSELDGILTKIMNYEEEADIDWRKSFLLPMSFSDPGTDGAYLGEAVKNDYLTPNGFSAWTMYAQGSGACGIDSPIDSSEELRGGYVVQQRWKDNPAGGVFWWGHGSTTGAYVGYGNCWDDNGASGQILQSNDATALDNTKPAVVYQNSCENGWPETWSNLGYALLRNGAIATVSASRVSWYAMGQWQPSRYAGDNAAIGYYFFEGIVNGETFGKALFDSKSGMEYGWGGETWMNLMDFNLYGDPSLRIDSSSTGSPIPAPTAVPTPVPTEQPLPPQPTMTPTVNPDIIPAGKYDDTDFRIHYQGGWKNIRHPKAWKKSFHYAPRSLAASFQVKGRKFSVIYMQRAARGAMTVYVDGVAVKSLNARSKSPRRRVWTGPSISAGTVHTITIKGAGANIDGVVVD